MFSQTGAEALTKDPRLRPLWQRRGVGPGERWHSKHARENSIRGQGGTPGSGRRPSAMRESYTASYHLVRLHVCTQRVRQRKTEETSVPREPVEGLLDRLRCHRPPGLTIQSLEGSCHGGRDRRWAHFTTGG